MKSLSILLLAVLLSFKAYSQNGYVYKNAELGIEVTFPFEPKVSVTNVVYSNQISAISNLIFTYGLSYSMIIHKNGYVRQTTAIMEYTYSNMGEVKSKKNYKLGEYDVSELEISMSGNCGIIKIVGFNKALVILQVSAENYPKEKDVVPFFNSLKVDGLSILNPLADNSLYKEYTLEKLSVGRTDTVKQIVYVNTGSKGSYQYEKLSDVDKNIPKNSVSNPYRFALIIGNEDYTSRQVDLKTESNVEFARNDASAFKEYCLNTLGLPEKNITFLLDATAGQITQGISKLKLLSKASSGKSQLIVFYAGHGLPDEKTKEPYLIPVDVNGSNVTAGIKLQDLYNSLTEFPSERIMVFLDACFTGGGRNAGLVASRGVKIMPKEDVLKGNLVVFSSSSGEQSSLPYADQKHGMFTYYLLKKLQETKGDVTYSDLSKFLDEKVSIESLLVNSKEQNPVVNTSQTVSATWKMWKAK
jgi:hypothetical protein